MGRQKRVEVIRRESEVVIISLSPKKRKEYERIESKVIADMNTFYIAFDIVRQLSPTLVPTRQERMDAYHRMEHLAKIYNHPTLRNKVDEAEAYLRKG
jgi:hypothetical protein